jgi:hypothetical protein
MRLGLPVGIAVGISSFGYSHSIVHGIATGIVIALIGTVVQGIIEAKAERRRQSKGITLKDAPVQAMLVLELAALPTPVMELCRQGLHNIGLRLKRTEIDEPLRIVALTRASFNSFGEKITVVARGIRDHDCSLRISSVPSLITTTSDLGTNYTNVFLLSRFIKEQLGKDALIEETLIDLEKDRREC